MKAKDIMRKRFKTIGKNESIGKALSIFMKDSDYVLPVFDKGKHVGELRSRDMLRLALDPKKQSQEQVLGPLGLKKAMEIYAKKVSDLMVEHEFTIGADENVEDIADLMIKEDVRAIPVINKKEGVIGIVSELEMLKYLHKKLG